MCFFFPIIFSPSPIGFASGIGRWCPEWLAKLCRLRVWGNFNELNLKCILLKPHINTSPQILRLGKGLAERLHTLALTPTEWAKGSIRSNYSTCKNLPCTLAPKKKGSWGGLNHDKCTSNWAMILGLPLAPTHSFLQRTDLDLVPWCLESESLLKNRNYAKRVL